MADEKDPKAAETDDDKREAARKDEQAEKSAKAAAVPEKSGDGHKDGSAALQEQVIAEQKRTGGAPRDLPHRETPVLLKPGEAATIPTGPGPGTDAIVTLANDVVVEFFPENALRPSHVQLFHKGQQVRQSEIDKAVATYAGK